MSARQSYYQRKKRGPKGLSALKRRQIIATPGQHVDVAKRFGVSPAYVCMLKSGARAVKFTPVEIISATLISMACGAAP